MKNQLLKINIEIARGHFAVAQIFIIMAGFFFASAGISYNNINVLTNEVIDLAIEVTSDNNTNYIPNQTALDLKAQSFKSTVKIWMYFFALGMFCVILSIFYCIWGNKTLVKLKENDSSTN